MASLLFVTGSPLPADDQVIFAPPGKTRASGVTFSGALDHAEIRGRRTAGVLHALAIATACREQAVSSGKARDSVSGWRSSHEAFRTVVPGRSTRRLRRLALKA